MKRLFSLIFSVFITTCIYGQIPYSESFETGFGIWSQLTTDNFDWTQNSGPTPSPGTGPNAASDGNNYLYIEATGHNNPSETAVIEAPFNFSGTTMPILSFDYHMYGHGIGFLSVWIFDGLEWKEVWNQLNEQGDQWNTMRLCLGNYANNANIKIKFRAETQYSDSSDIAIDNIKIVDFKYIGETQTNVTCGTYSDGDIGITITGGFGPYEYSINDGIDYTADAATSHTFSSLPGGDYPLKVKESTGCEIVGPIISLSEPQVPSISYAKTDVSPCIESGNGGFTVTATGTYPPFTYSKDGFGGPFQASNIFSSLDTGNYQIAVKNNNGCIALGNIVEINCPAEIKILAENPTDVSTCFGDCNGAVSITAGGGNPPLNYALDTAAALIFGNSSYFSNLCVGSYRVIIEDNSGCRDTTNYVTINQPSLLTLISNNHTDVTGCYGDANGTITVLASGGTGTINYSIDNGTSYQTSGNFTNLDAADYHILVRDQHNCQVNVGTVTVNQPALLQIDSTKYNNVTGCFGNANAEIHIYAKGGTLPLKYSIDGINQVPTFDFTNLNIGDYFPYVEDANGCNKSSSQITITQPSSLLITNVNIYDINDCYGTNTGSIQIFAAQGTEPYEYSIDNGANFQAIYTFSNVYAGNYQIIVRDANGCTKILDSLVTVKQPQAITITDELASDVSCNGSDDGSIFVNASGGTGALLYSVDNGLTYPYSVGSYTYLAANSYQISVKDEKNCHVSGSLLTINQPDSLLIDSIKVINVDGCYADNSGTITIYAKGGTTPLYYSIDNGAIFQSSSVFNNLPAKTGYFPYVKDDNGCFVLGNQQTIGQPSQLIVTNQSHTNIEACHGTPIGTISVNSAGGTGTIYYSIDGINFLDNSGNFTNLYAGTYNIKIKDSKNCIANGWEEIIVQPDTFLIDSVKSKNVKCSGLGNGEIYIYTSGGKSQISYSINNGLSYQTAVPQFLNLTPATYNIIVKDNYNCQVTSSAVITEPSLLVLDSVIHTNVNTCNGDSTGTISIYNHGGTPAYQYAYSTVSTTPTKFFDSNIFNKVKAGSYFVTLKDQNGCTETSGSFTITQPTIIQMSNHQITNVTCFGLNDGTISITAAGGTPGYEYSIDNGLNWYNNSGLFTSLAPNSYTLTIRDANLCQVKYSYTEQITQPSQLKIDDFQHYNPTCFGYTDGQIIVFPTGGTSPYSYTLDDTLTQTQSVFSNLQQGQFWVTLTDKHNCVAHSDTVDIIMPTNKALFTSSVVDGCSPLTVEFTPFNTLSIFKWDFGDTFQATVISPSHIFENNSGATIDYLVTAVAEQNVCSDTARDTITVYSQPDVSFDIDNPVHYFPDTNVVFSNINSSFSDYHWEFGDNTAYDGMDPISHNFPDCGNYNISLTAQNTHNCWDTAYQSVVITSVDPDANFIMDKDEGCEPLAVNFTNTSSTSVRYEWIYDEQIFSTDTNPHLEFSNSSNYLVTLKAYGYCNKIDSMSRIIYVYPSPHIDFNVSPDTIGVGQDTYFQNNSTGAAYYIWNFGDGFYSGDDSPRRSYATPGTYTVILKGTSANSCSDSLELQNIVFVSNDFYFKLPSAFSPDGDGLNDLFKPLFNMVTRCRINIYSRRGELVFRTDDFANTFWDGTFRGHSLPIDVYIWDASGTYLSGEEFHSLGSVTIIR